MADGATIAMSGAPPRKGGASLHRFARQRSTIAFVMALPLIKTYRRHRCAATHRTVRSWARCAFPRAEWIAGAGSVALLAWCRPLTITLHATIDAAAPFLADIDTHGCGHTCTGRHELVRFDWTAP